MREYQTSYGVLRYDLEDRSGTLRNPNSTIIKFHMDNFDRVHIDQGVSSETRDKALIRECLAEVRLL